MEEFAHKNSRLSVVFLLCISSVVTILLLDHYFSVLPFHGVYLFFYLLFVSLASIWITFTFIQNLLKHSRPIDCDLENNIYIKCFKKIYFAITGQDNQIETILPLSGDVVDSSLFKRPVGSDSQQKDLEERIREFAEDVEKLYVSKWYKNITVDDTFRMESRKLIEDVTRRFLQVVVVVNGKKVLHRVLVILLKHLKEYRKTVKRLKKNNGSNIEELYRYAHIGSKSIKAQEYYVQQLTASLLRQFINWELWNSLPCRTLVSILSRKLTNYILIYLSKPGFINYRLLKAVASKDHQDKLELNSYSFVSLSGCRELKKPIEKEGGLKIDQKLLADSIDGGNTPKETPKKSTKLVQLEVSLDEVDAPPVCSDTVVKDNEQETEPEYTGSRAVSKPVKIYESKSANKTWRNSSDLECISLGQDILTNLSSSNEQDKQMENFMDRILWKEMNDMIEMEQKQKDHLEDEAKPEMTERASPPSSIPNFLRPSTTGAATLITNTIKPIGNVTSIFQQSTVDTVNNVVKPVSQATSTAMHKIGDLQDEAAGVMEGILDFGMAGIRKGLRLTGLQDNLTEATTLKTKSDHQHRTKKPIEHARIAEPKPKGHVKLPKWPQIVMDDPKADLATEAVTNEESVWVNPLSKESPSFEEPILLEKTPLEPNKPFSLDTESSENDKQSKTYDIPQISTDSEHVDSPDPEYEEPADFASTIAKLRSLLQQKSSESNLTTPAVSPMPPDDSLKTTPVESSTEVGSEVDGVMPSLYKFCARTATGVFQNTLNTIKTALPGNVQEHVQPSMLQGNVDNWTYVATDSSNSDMLVRMEKLLMERREFCTVDTAYEAIDSLQVDDQPDDALIESTVSLDDELDDFEQQIPIAKVLTDVLCELVIDSDTYLVQEASVKSFLLLLGNHVEKYFEQKSDKIVRNINKLVGNLPTSLNQETKPMKLDDMVKVCVDSVPGSLKALLSESTVSASFRLLISSLQYQRINQDVFLQIFELLAQQVVVASGQLTPTFSA